jgi:hypothetical protein
MDTVVTGLQGLILAIALGVPQQAATPPPPAEPAQAPQQVNPPIELPVSLEKIQEALARPRAIRPTIDRPVFRVEVFARKPTVEDILGPDYLRGPAYASGMSHKEFLDMVTPVEYRGMSMFTNGEVLTIAATSVGLQWALMKAIDRLKEARTERAQAAARQEVLDAMNDLAAARKKAGLPAK